MIKFLRKSKNEVKEECNDDIISARQYHDVKQYQYEEDRREMLSMRKSVWESYSSVNGQKELKALANEAIRDKMASSKSGWPEFILRNVDYDIGYTCNRWEGCTDEDIERPFKFLMEAGWDVHMLGTNNKGDKYSWLGYKIQLRDVKAVTSREKPEYIARLPRNSKGELLGRLEWGY